MPFVTVARNWQQLATFCDNGPSSKESTAGTGTTVHRPGVHLSLRHSGVISYINNKIQNGFVSFFVIKTRTVPGEGTPRRVFSCKRSSRWNRLLPQYRRSSGLSFVIKKRVFHIFVIWQVAEAISQLLSFVLRRRINYGRMGAAIIIRTAVVTRHSVRSDTLENKTAVTRRRSYQRYGRKRKGKPTEFEMVRISKIIAHLITPLCKMHFCSRPAAAYLTWHYGLLSQDVASLFVRKKLINYVQSRC